MQESLIISTLIVSVAALVMWRQYLQAKERRAMIERGLDPALVDIASRKKSGRIFLYSGIMLLGIALGTIAGIIFAGILDIPGETKECIVLSLIIFSGLSCFTCYYLSRDKHA